MKSSLQPEEPEAKAPAEPANGSPVILKSADVGKEKVPSDDGHRMEKNSSKNKIVPIQVEDGPPPKQAKVVTENGEKTQAPAETTRPLQTPMSKDADSIKLHSKLDQDDRELPTCNMLSSYVLNHEFMDLQVHDKGSGNIRCMCNMQWCVRLCYYLIFAGIIGFAFYYPIMMGTSSGEVRKIRTFTSPNAVSQK